MKDYEGYRGLGFRVLEDRSWGLRTLGWVSGPGSRNEGSGS